MKESIASLSDEEILTRFREGRRLSQTEHPFSDTQIFVITEDAIAKGSQDLDEDISYPSEAFVLDIVREHTSIPVPRVQRVIRQRWDYLIVMDLVPGKQLSTVWPTMTGAEKDKVAETLADYVQQLRTIRIPQQKKPGPLDRDLNPRKCESRPVFGQIISCRGPFASYADLEAFFNGRREQMMLVGTVGEIPPFDASYPLVLTHQDLNPRNIIVGPDGTLTVVDWTWAGFYPEWWESLAMTAQAEHEEHLQGRADPSWDAIIPRVCGEYKEMVEWLTSIGQSLSWG